jgi:hypothetical protein
LFEKEGIGEKIDVIFSFRLLCPTIRRKRMVEQVNNNKDNLYIIHIIQRTQELNHIHHQVHHHRIHRQQLHLRQMKMNLEVKEDN